MTDTSGDSFPGVTVIVRRASDDGHEKRTVTDEKGRCRLSDLNDGAYTIAFELLGFATLEQPDTVLANGTTRTVDAHLAMGYEALDVPRLNGWIGTLDDGGSQLPCESISMDASGGLIFFSGASYRVVFRTSGGAELRSLDSFNGPPTRLTGRISRSEFGKLCLADLLTFDRLAPVVGTSAHDIGDTKIEIADRNGSHSVRESGGGGTIEFWALFRAIDDLERQIK